MAGTAERVLALKLIGDVSDINKQMKGVTGKFKQMSQEAGKWGKALAGGVIVDGISAIGDALGTAFGDLKTQDRLLKQTQQVLKTTGGAAKISAKQIVDLSSSLEDLSGIDQEAVQAAENLLLTFTKIRGPVFRDATKVALDMSVALGTDLSGAAMKVGRALNDPLKGITSLTRIGVTFSDQQKQQIANYVKAGQVAKAQGIVLDELNKKFGGSAKAFGNSFEGRIAKIGQRVGDLAQSLIKPLLPVANSVLGIITDGLSGDMGKVGKGIDRLINGYTQTIYKGKGKKRVAVGVQYVPGLASGVTDIADTITSTLQSALKSAGSIDWSKIITFDNVASTLNGVISGLQSNQTILASIGVVAVALGAALSAGMFVVSVFTSAAAAVFALPAWAVGTVVSTAVAAVGAALGVAFRGAMFVASAISSAAAGAFNAVAKDKALLAVASSAGSAFGHRITAGILSGLVLADIVNMIADQLGLPRDVTSNLDRGRQFTDRVLGPGNSGGHNGQRRGGGFALGTSSAPAGWSWVGERGPELMRFRGGERVIPHARSVAMAGAGGGNHYSINMGLVTDPVAAGRQVVLAIREYERRSGAGWRK